MAKNQSLSILISILLFLSLSTGCIIGDRLDIDRVLVAVESIRHGQKEFWKREKRYASLEELIKSRLVDAGLSDGEEAGYRFDLSARVESYLLKVSKAQPQTAPTGGEYHEELSIYLDETGIIRASTDPKNGADSRSSEISPKP